ncbi:MAG: hypothetical protein WBZ24_05460 [Anaerolineales bacterium]
MSEEEKPGQEDVQPDLETPVQPAEEMPQPAPDEAPPGRLARWGSTFLRWATALGVALALGVVLVWFLRVRPQTQELRLLSQNLQETQQQLSTAQAEADNLRPLKDENTNLQNQMEQSKNHLALLSVLVDLTSSQLALAEDNPLAAQAALKNTDSKLASIQSGIDSGPAKTVKSMRDRLATALDELSSNDLFAAKRDLEVITNTLVDLESTLFSAASP